MTVAEPRMLSVADGPLVAATFGLDAGGRLSGPVARGQLGQIWRLDADGTSWAVKEWFASPDAAAVEAHEEFVDASLAAGVFTPRSRLSVWGTVLAEVEGTAVRVLEWVDLAPRTRRLDPTEVGRTVGRLHLAGTPTSERIINWFSTGMGAQAWRDTHRRLIEADAPFADALEALLPDLIAVESVIEPHERAQVCHRDLWSDNVLASADGRVCVIDFENVGPADPSQELAMVLFEFGDDDPERARELHSAYVEAGGPGRVSRRGHFTMLVAQQAHIASYACARWIGESDPAERDRLEAWFRETPEDPVTLERIDRILAAIE
jgi:Ser/Thr protein kinase RdoA (MazF antagonist)